MMNTTSDGNISSIELIDEGLSLITKKKQSIMCNKPTIVGASILELSKLFMLNFHYNVMKKKTMPTTLLRQILLCKKAVDFYHNPEVNSIQRAHFDFSNFPRHHKLFDQSNEKQVLKFKDELAGTPIKELCIKTKIYSIVAGD